ncbi:alpha/beta fold hydrolase [Phreatobacter sp.]|uniref:alpha/beta fold hydrolase n=1 Tax=Phreatobacter sp. TaxID=1966341 RepID=UPI0022BFCCFD|nr:alpha/beta fold hydrolase [Phreatobacter sp.]MCZ8315962.1 alpha/beta fold hydrolase [Phreatobacter sp.]
MAPALTDIGTGRTLVLLHGWAVDRSFFTRQAPLAEQGYRLLAPDLPGHGERAAIGGATTMAALADDLRNMLAAERLDGAVLVGWSMGAMLALELLARGPSPALAGLVIVDMSPRIANDAHWRHGLAGGQDFDATHAAADRMHRHWADYAGRIARSMFAEGGEEDDGLVADATTRIAARDPALMAGYWRSLVEADHRATVARLPVPVLAIAGGRSRLYRSGVATWIAATAPHGHAVTMPDAGHAPHLEQPDAFNAIVARFAAGL